MMDDYDYIIWHMEESEEELRSQLSHPEYYADQVAKLKPGSKRLKEVLAVRCALKVLFYGEEQQVCYDASGAPSLPNGPFLSISHTADYAAVCVSPDPVGIDIERIGTRVQRVVSQFLKEEELVLLQMVSNVTDSSVLPLPDVEPFSLALHLAWSAKEAIYKVLGHDYFDLKQLVSVVYIDWHHQSLWLLVEGKPTPWRVKFICHPDYVFCLVRSQDESSTGFLPFSL